MTNWKNITKFCDEKEHVSKFVFEKDDIAIESVLYRYPTYEERTVLCISVMCGCPMGCRFCGTGDFYVRNLKAEEIAGQAKYILENEIDGLDPAKIKKLQIMFMSMGEGLLNKQLSPACYILHELYPQAALLISTSAPKVDFDWVIKLSKDIPTVGLQFSVHESTNEARDLLIPFENKMSLEDISVQGMFWSIETGRRPYFNYCAHEGNVKADDALRLLKLFPPSIWEATVSVVCERDKDKQGSNKHQRELAINFGNSLLALGFNVRVFDPAGQDTIGGGCGQLLFVQDWMKSHQDKVRPSCGNGLQKVHAPMFDAHKVF